MVKDLLIKRLLTQAGVSVLAGLLMSSAVLAEDVTTDAGDTSESSVGIEGVDQGDGDQGDGNLGGGDDLGGGDLSGGDPDVSIDPNDPGLDGGDIGGEDGSADGGTADGGGAAEGGEAETGEGSAPDVSIDFGTELDAPVEVTVDLSDPPEPIADMDPSLPAQSGSGDVGQTPEGNGGETDSHTRRQVK